MAEVENRNRVLILTLQHRIEGEMKVGPDGSLWDFKHRPDEKFMTVYDAQFVKLNNGQRDYDVVSVEINKDQVVALIRGDDLVFMRTEQT